MSTISLFLLFLLLTSIPITSSLTFNFSTFDQTQVHTGSCTQGSATICFQGNANLNEDNTIYLSTFGYHKAGRAYYSEPVPLWSPTTGRLANFTTQFEFWIEARGSYTVGDGFTFFLVPYPSVFHLSSSDCWLGLYNPDSQAENRLVAVEFDTYNNSNIHDPSPTGVFTEHVGIDVNSMESKVTVPWESGIRKGRLWNANVMYNSATGNLNVSLNAVDKGVVNGRYSLSYKVNLSLYLPNQIAIGFSGSTGGARKMHRITSWNFISDLKAEDVKVEVKEEVKERGKRNKTWMIVGVSIGSAVVLISLVVCAFLAYCWVVKKRKLRSSPPIILDPHKGPHSFPYHDLVSATNGFSEHNKLGEGGFGAVYKGYISSIGKEVAIKRVSHISENKKKEYKSEVEIISQLKHRNLVQLYGWYHDKNELLLIYEFMDNKSLHYHLFDNKYDIFNWNLRYKIAVELASSLLYLHEGSEKCVVHRDVKSSNVLLDSHFNTKLGDFGLARFLEHDNGGRTMTQLAGTKGYMAPEYLITERASKESDVYSFGVVVLELACGRKALEQSAKKEIISLVGWVWSIYCKGSLLDAADPRLTTEVEGVDREQLEQLILVGMWCAHPYLDLRPSIRQAIGALNMEIPIPELPKQMPLGSLYFYSDCDTSTMGTTSSDMYGRDVIYTSESPLSGPSKALL